jgi:hypothetical protein
MSRQAATASQPATRAPMPWGIVVGALQAATPLVFWWLDSATVYALGLAAIAAIYVGFAVADGRPKVIAVESNVAFAFVIVASTAISGSPWLLVAGFVGHGLKDLWQHRTHFVANTRWWPPFCMVVDWVVAAIIVGEITAGCTSARARPTVYTSVRSAQNSCLPAAPSCDRLARAAGARLDDPRGLRTLGANV